MPEELRNVQEDDILRDLGATQTPETRTDLTRALRVVITPEAGSRAIERWHDREPDLVRRIIWALGETHASAAAPLIRTYVDVADESVAGVALTALWKTDSAMAEQVVKSFRLPKGREMVRRLEDVRRALARGRGRRCEVTMAKVSDRVAVHEICDQLLDDLFLTGNFGIDLRERHMPGAVGTHSGMWFTIGFSLALNMAGNVLWELGKKLVSAIRKLQSKVEYPFVNRDAAFLIAYADLDESQSIHAVTVRVVELGELYYDSIEISEAHFFVELHDGTTIHKITISTDGRVTSHVMGRCGDTSSIPGPHRARQDRHHGNAEQ
jgi:hypothetical protein